MLEHIKSIIPGGKMPNRPFECISSTMRARQKAALDSKKTAVSLLCCRLLPFLPENRRIADFHARANEM
jgi:hypothetical protein